MAEGGVESRVWYGEARESGPFAILKTFFNRGMVQGRASAAAPVQAASSETDAASGASGREGIARAVGSRLPGLRVLAVIARSGEVDRLFPPGPSLDTEALSELVTLARIAQRTAEDAGAGGLCESSWSFDRFTVLTRRMEDERFMILIGEPDLQVGLARYVLRQTAARLDSLR